MKKALIILFGSLLLLSACNNKENDSTDSSKSSDTTKSTDTSKSSKVDDNKVQFKNDTLVLKKAVLKIKNVFLVNDKDSKNKHKLLAFEYEVKSKANDKAITATNVWIASLNATQDSKDTVNNLELGSTPSTGKFESWRTHSHDAIKKGGTAKGIITYQLQNDKEVTLTATQGIVGKKLGSKKIDISKLKTVDYSISDDIQKETNNN
ncbi:DUF5067 domain-containing protein [Staphylococcus simiae]|uniref:DUF5067 domain-containing protein n=1 Tax=Staphylococcus simiae TaxID=308354 RepID=UPI001A973ED0|nr:DUF5067 domain-containing protein [Staphylococcus simiae]MBO1202269.1 DUF5067 domain-containing protein [Staphylococcus simiae]MBO1204525.1 DUF5067 domain-containing protein [Staphylococcus simiae]MBO1212066.1 DUF5067 domain-containing protein [Staphylococcus simiae]MBO1230694.1 DUF5067 domain-containing protein [Staphylococcus simiae]QSY54527.1 DUF5067 domain-containing protein [Staphylococcus simiae]